MPSGWGGVGAGVDKHTLVLHMQQERQGCPCFGHLTNWADSVLAEFGQRALPLVHAGALLLTNDSS
jgi:hypothetical protein